MTDTNTLKDKVQNWINENKENGYTEKQLLEDLQRAGCQSGMVSGLIYYTDTVAFYDEHEDEISKMLQNSIEMTGLSINELFGDKWDESDPLANDKFNKNLLAWFAFEETAFEIYRTKYE